MAYTGKNLDESEGTPPLVLQLLARLPRSICQKVAGQFACMIHVFDLVEQRNLWVSGSVAERLGYTREEIQTMGMLALATLVHPEDLTLVAEYFQRFSGLQSGEILEITYRMRRADGTWGRFRSRETPYLRSTRDPSPQLLGIVEEIAETRPSPIGRTAPEPSPSVDRTRYSIEIVTGEPDGTYSLGPFGRAETEFLYHRYFRGLQDGEDGRIAVSIEKSPISRRPPLRVVPRKSEPYRPG
ncbi:PAS domain-containing protein [Pannus brasiliensis CCIBt3594]|uniref:PAS domain-containing protein n=1 Tax=Pannus brasiliensis CCIBt3594 TaxID=1427578 RepID=A0AAW9QN45_9CHRO